MTTKWRVARQEWEKPEPSTAWRGAGGVATGIAVCALIAALTVSEHAAIRITLPWAIAALGAVVAILCQLAHWDANRGRKPRNSEVIEEKIEGPDPRSGVS